MNVNIAKQLTKQYEDSTLVKAGNQLQKLYPQVVQKIVLATKVGTTFIVIDKRTYSKELYNLLLNAGFKLNSSSKNNVISW